MVFLVCRTRTIELVVTVYVYAHMPKEISFYVFLGEKRDPSEIYANFNLHNLTHIFQKPSYVYVFHLHAQRNLSLRG
jgi:hypothetical protein